METRKSLAALLCLSLGALDALGQEVSEADRASLARLHLAISREEKPSVVYSRSLAVNAKAEQFQVSSSSMLFSRDKRGKVLSVQLINHPDNHSTVVSWFDGKSAYFPIDDEIVKVKMSAFSEIRMPSTGLSFGSYSQILEDLGNEAWKASDFEPKSGVQPGFCGGGLAAHTHLLKPNRLPKSLVSTSKLLGTDIPKQATIWVSVTGTPLICRIDVEFTNGARVITTYEFGAMEVLLPRSARTLSATEIAEMKREMKRELEHQ